MAMRDFAHRLTALFRGAGALPVAPPPCEDAQWTSIAWFDGALDTEGCSADFWIRKGRQEALAFFCKGGFDGHPPGWFNPCGEPVEFEPDLFRPADESAGS